MNTRMKVEPCFIISRVSNYLMAKINWTSINRGIFLILWFFVAFVEVCDIYWSIKLQDTLMVNERNPIGRLLLSMDGGDVALFMSLKISAIIIILGTLPVILWSERLKTAWILLGIIFVSRLLLLIYFETGHLW